MRGWSRPDRLHRMRHLLSLHPENRIELIGGHKMSLLNSAGFLFHVITPSSFFCCGRQSVFRVPKCDITAFVVEVARHERGSLGKDGTPHALPKEVPVTTGTSFGKGNQTVGSHWLETRISFHVGSASVVFVASNQKCKLEVYATSNCPCGVATNEPHASGLTML